MPRPTSAANVHDTSVASRLGGSLVDATSVDVGAARERARHRRLWIVAIVVGLPTAFLWYRILDGRPFNVFALPSLPGDPVLYILPIAIILALGLVVAMPLMAGRSPHVAYRPEQLEVTFDDVKGLDGVVDEVIKSLNTFLGYAMYRDRLGGNPRRGVLFEGPPGTGKTHMAKAMARQAGVPFLFVSATSFQSMWYGATARKIRNYFKVLRKTARREGGAIGFIEEIDAIATTRGGMNGYAAQSAASPTRLTPAPGGAPSGARDGGGSASPFAQTCATAAQALGMDVRTVDGTPVTNRMTSESTGGVVNELLIQLQSFDEAPLGERLYNTFASAVNSLLPAHRQLSKSKPDYTNILLIAATNRADNLDPALLRPGRFDRRLAFERPAKKARRELIDYFLSKKAHADELDTDELRGQLAGQTFGYTPVMIEHLLDEALVIGLRSGRDEMNFKDIQSARLTEEIGLKNPVEYTEKERRTVATHEAGHATIAYLTGTRRLEVLSIIKRKGSLGLLAHGDPEEVYTRSKKEMYDLIDISMGGMCAEEVFFDEAGTGPGGDLAYATQVACEVVGSAGMAASLVSLAAVQNGALSDSNLVGRVLNDGECRPEVDRILVQSKAKVRALIAANTHIVEALRDALLERDELIGEEIIDVIEAAGDPVTDGLTIERRGGDRRRADWLAGSSMN